MYSLEYDEFTAENAEMKSEQHGVRVRGDGKRDHPPSAVDQRFPVPPDCDGSFFSVRSVAPFSPAV